MRTISSRSRSSSSSNQPERAQKKRAREKISLPRGVDRLFYRREGTSRGTDLGTRDPIPKTPRTSLRDLADRRRLATSSLPSNQQQPQQRERKRKSERWKMMMMKGSERKAYIDALCTRARCEGKKKRSSNEENTR